MSAVASGPAPNGASIDVKPQESLSVELQEPHKMQRTRSGGIQMGDGTLYVSRPFRTNGNNKSRAIISFVPRNSTFDPQNSRNPNEFRGFYTLFWISMFLLVIQNYVVTMEKNGYPIEMAFAAMFSRHAFTLALSDGVLVLSTGFCVPFAIALKKGWLNFSPWGVVIQHTFQTLVLAVAVTWTFKRKWPWVQSGFLTLHSLVMIMKMHSYMSTNGYLQNVHRNFEKTMAKLRSATSNVGGWDVAIVEAASHVVDEPTPQSSPEDLGASPSITPIPGGTQRSYIDGDVAIALRKKLLSVPDERNESRHEKVMQIRKKIANDFAVLVHHPNQDVAALAEELVEMEEELTSQGPEKVRWPDNISLKSFADYMLIPTLVYELEYPRTDRIRPLYVFEKTVATFGTFALLYTITENFILPLVPTSRDQSFFRSLLDLALPFMIAYLLLFYIIFECVCNGFAELSRFADRQFYEDWWNSTSWDEFARKWNRPVHTFLLRHVYASSIKSYKLSKKSAMLITFFLSACLHELVMAIVTKKIRMYLFMLQLIQIPLIAIGRMPFIKRNQVVGNVVFWVGLYAGFPLLCVAYCAY
ncbi:MBOAT-domain-containing protein [Fomitiporia mediterranea MF3/22]|uniref:MBOAT-domain-containing protein n=1 Tax=Fomitiporia mediterranea (strain MF3/22) TaxID=694068 RepID=UPI0004407849|nr:MBOAT-domain-containing protein [Fomitiporia mediterranea MF3/22]EJD07524.1 MBOAT-domain-containing protein [Fomitiporia mediterranea MF3/22]